MAQPPLQFPQTFNRHNKIRNSELSKYSCHSSSCHLTQNCSQNQFYLHLPRMPGKTIKMLPLSGPRFKPWNSQSISCSGYSRRIFCKCSISENQSNKQQQQQQQRAQALGTRGHGCNILTRCCHLHDRQRQLSRDQSPATMSTANIATFSVLSVRLLSNFAFRWNRES